MSTGLRAWIVLGAAVTVYEVFAPEGELLSEVVDRGLVSHRLLTAGAVLVTAAHLLNVLPKCVDPFAYLAMVRL